MNLQRWRNGAELALLWLYRAAVVFAVARGLWAFTAQILQR